MNFATARKLKMDRTGRRDLFPTLYFVGTHLNPENHYGSLDIFITVTLPPKAWSLKATKGTPKAFITMEMFQGSPLETPALPTFSQ
ncbi:MAG: hypothetical protein M3Y08_14615 [Fibrobacterota bacterium]|nr:hypothetical protein [Fibrobacterota bacterium]